jgi:DNA-binding transcriptional ArsR family regulator
LTVSAIQCTVYVFLKNKKGDDNMQNQKIAEMEAQLALMQEELERMKRGDVEPAETHVPTRGIYEKYSDRIEAVRDDMFNLFGEIVHEEKIHSVTTYVSAGKNPCSGNIELLCTGTGIFSSFDDISEEGLSAALDVYTNPRRIAILKALAKSELSASEISQRTRLQGGQLYHHLSILESAKLITKTTDKYKSNPKVPGLLTGLHAVIGGMEIARN